ncbi:MAG TPA: hypothetical protein VK400_06760 [Pyrinomonadaceae bacterium]|nr:hypothetical protein [Pyrinomonadaceae bacterium]
MSYLRKFGLVVSAIAFSLSLYAATADAQWRQDGDREYRERSVYGDRSSQNRRWNRSRSVYRRQYRTYGWQQGSRYGRISPREYWRLQRQRSRIYRSSNRAYRDGYLSDSERRRLMRQQYRYRRNVYRDRRDW